MQAVRIDANGMHEPFQCTGGELARSLKLIPRDLRLLATRNINLAVRKQHFLFRFPPITGIVTSERVVLIADNGGSDASGDEHSRGFSSLAAQVLESEITRAVHRPSGVGDVAGYLYDGLFDSPLPFELRVLDAVLREDLQRKQVCGGPCPPGALPARAKVRGAKLIAQLRPARCCHGGPSHPTAKWLPQRPNSHAPPPPPPYAPPVPNYAGAVRAHLAAHVPSSGGPLSRLPLLARSGHPLARRRRPSRVARAGAVSAHHTLRRALNIGAGGAHRHGGITTRAGACVRERASLHGTGLG